MLSDTHRTLSQTLPFFVHAYRAPAYHAQRLRSIRFARRHTRRLLWVAAHDKETGSNNHARTPAEAEASREHWLRYHERFTNGIPGLLPLVLDLPMRFTDSPNPEAKDQGIYKYTKGILRGWELEEAEANRIASLGDTAEIVLLRRPSMLYVEVPNANDRLTTCSGFKKTA